MERKGLHTVKFQSMHFTLRRFSIVFAALALCLVVAAGAAARSDNHASSRVSGITVYAASSLTDVFPQIDSGPKYSFAASSTLAAQITQGAPADVFASANTTIPDQLYAKGIVDKPVIFTRNRLVLVVPTSNPAGIHSVYDLKKPGIKLVIAASAVPVGSYTLQVLKQMGLTTSVLANVVSRESDVRSVLAKVALGEADAGFVYSTDAKTVPGKVTVLKIPAWAQPKVTYEFAVVSKSANKTAAQAFLKEVLSKAGQKKMLAAGFLPIPTTKSGY
jgi:molybdate transport system substrate-binding protein